MAIHYNPTTVSDGLVLALDAANTRSYVGSGTTWTDVSYNGNNGTLTNGPAYTTVGFTEPFGGAGGVYFDGSGDYLRVANGSFLTFTGDFTVEAWIYSSFTGGPGVQGFVLIDTRTAYTQSNWTFGVFSSGGAVQFIYSGGVLSSSVNCVSSAWNHVAVTRSGTTLKMFVNGVEGYSGTVSGTIATGSNANATIGAGFDAANYASPGYCSNLRVVNGTALYTSNFTPPRSLLPAVSGTSLLTCQKGSIRDASSNNFAITVNGDARPVYGFPSFKFDGTNDYVTIGSFPNTTFDFGSGAFTLECWINISTFAAGGATTYGINAIYATGDSDVGSDFRFLILQGSTLGGYTTNGVYLTVNSTPIAIGAYSSFTTNTWYHCVATRIGNNIYIFLNGELLSTTSYASSIPNATSYQPSIGVVQYGGSFLYQINGKISGVKIYKGKGLTAEEVEQNYNALKGRFGL